MTPNERKLNRALRILADDGPQEAPAEVAEALLVAFRRHHRKRKMTMWWSVGSAAAAIAAGVVMFMLARPASPPVPATEIFAQAQARATSALPAQQNVAAARKTHRVRKTRMPRQETAEFYALPDADTNIPLEHATVVRVQLPMSDLRAMGFLINEQRAADRVQTDVLLGQDGTARAVRFVQ